MRSIIKSSFLWQFSIGFALGAVGLFTLHPADTTQTIESHFGLTQPR